MPLSAASHSLAALARNSKLYLIEKAHTPVAPAPLSAAARSLAALALAALGVVGRQTHLPQADKKAEVHAGVRWQQCACLGLC